MGSERPWKRRLRRHIADIDAGTLTEPQRQASQEYIDTDQGGRQLARGREPPTEEQGHWSHANERLRKAAPKPNLPRHDMTFHPLQGRKRNRVFTLVGAALLLAGSVFGVDWANYFLGTRAPYPAIGKPLITLLAMLLVLSIGRERLSHRDWGLLFAAFCCMLPTDLLMSVVAVNPNVGVGSPAFMVGGVLSILAHLFLILRLAAHGAPAWKKEDGWHECSPLGAERIPLAFRP